MFKIYFFFFLSVLFTACSSKLKLPDAPNDLIPEDSMVMIIKDVSVLEANIQNRYKSVNVFYQVMNKSSLAYFEKIKIDTTRFKKSFEYYASNAEKLQKLNSQVIDSLNKDALLLKK